MTDNTKKRNYESSEIINRTVMFFALTARVIIIPLISRLAIISSQQQKAENSLLVKNKLWKIFESLIRHILIVKLCDRYLFNMKILSMKKVGKIFGNDQSCC